MTPFLSLSSFLDYQTERMDETIKVVNPRYREFERQIRSKNAKLSRKRAKYGALILEAQIEEDEIKEYV